MRAATVDNLSCPESVAGFGTRVSTTKLTTACPTAFHVGGRFVPPAIAEQYSLTIPPYHAAEQSVELVGSGGEDGPSSSTRADL